MAVGRLVGSVNMGHHHLVVLVQSEEGNLAFLLWVSVPSHHFNLIDQAVFEVCEESGKALVGKGKKLLPRTAVNT